MTGPLVSIFDARREAQKFNTVTVLQHDVGLSARSACEGRGFVLRGSSYPTTRFFPILHVCPVLFGGPVFLCVGNNLCSAATVLP